MEREVHEEGGKEKSLPHSCRGESVQLLELVKACYTSKCARARDYVLELSNLVKGLRSYTRGMYSSV